MRGGIAATRGGVAHDVSNPMVTASRMSDAAADPIRKFALIAWSNALRVSLNCNQRRESSMAPLLLPEECIILLIDPLRRNIERTDNRDGNHRALANRHALIQKAARVLDVPKFFAVYGEPDTADEREWIARPCNRSQLRVYAIRPTGSLWSGSGIGAALAQEGRACLVLCGFWLEGSITFAALNALADGFDVFVLLDACPSCDKRAESAAVDRLLQAGVVPLTTTQMVREWAEDATDESRRSLLLDLLQPT